MFIRSSRAARAFDLPAQAVDSRRTIAQVQIAGQDGDRKHSHKLPGARDARQAFGPCGDRLAACELFAPGDAGTFEDEHQDEDCGKRGERGPEGAQEGALIEAR